MREKQREGENRESETHRLEAGHGHPLYSSSFTDTFPPVPPSTHPHRRAWEGRGGRGSAAGFCGGVARAKQPACRPAPYRREFRYLPRSLIAPPGICPLHGVVKQARRRLDTESHTMDSADTAPAMLTESFNLSFAKIKEYSQELRAKINPRREEKSEYQ